MPGVASATPAHAGRPPGSEDAGRRARARSARPGGGGAGGGGAGPAEARLRSPRRLVAAVAAKIRVGNDLSWCCLVALSIFSKRLLAVPSFWFSLHSSEVRKSECVFYR